MCVCVCVCVYVCVCGCLLVRKGQTCEILYVHVHACACLLVLLHDCAKRRNTPCVRVCEGCVRTVSGACAFPLCFQVHVSACPCRAPQASGTLCVCVCVRVCLCVCVCVRGVRA